MLKVILADDEAIIRETIAQMIDWKGLGMELVGMCRDGIEAYNMILDESPDIVLTDIKMPGLSGLELIRRVRESKLPVQFAILSGYGEFEFAKQAMSDGVKYYLLKPCNEHQIEECMLSIREDCQKARSLDALQEQQNSLTGMLHDATITNVLREVLTLRQVGTEVFVPYEQYLDMENQQYYLIEASISTLVKVEHLLGRLQVIFAAKKRRVSLHGVYVEGQLLLFFPYLGGDYLELDAVLKENADELPQRTYYSGLQQLLLHLHEKVKRKGTIHCIHSFHVSLVCNFKNVMESSLAIVPTEAGVPWDIQAIEEYLGGISNVDFLRQMIADLLLKSTAPPMEVASFLLQLSQENDHASILRSALGEFSRLNAAMETPSSAFMERLIAILDEHLGNPNLSLKWIAQNHLFMNVDYASRKILRESGKKFSTLLAELRVQRAKELLLEAGDPKMQTIAEQVGCGNNPQYFSQLFKKVTGQTPSAFVKQMRS
jgi:two-component system response regulator YesN